MIRWLLILGLIAPLAPASLARADEPLTIAQALAEFEASYAKQLKALATRHAESAGDDIAQALNTWRPEPDPQRLQLWMVGTPESLPAGGGSEWQQDFAKLRNKAADVLFALAGEAAAAGDASLALRLAAEAVRENPQHAEARKALGYIKGEDGVWRTPFEKQMHTAGNVWHPKFGWLKRDDVERYEAGERRSGNGWISAAEDAQRRADIKDGWQIRTEHFNVTTNDSLEAGVELATRLERLWQAWRQLFVGYYATSADLKNVLSGAAAAPRQTKPHEVTLFRSKADYVDALRAAQPRIEMTLGIYFDDRRRSYFFSGEGDYEGNTYHEAVHQLFQELRRVPLKVGRKNNFWIVEGIALYFESLTNHGSYLTLGGPDSTRIKAARHRLLVDNFYVPLAELTSLGTEAIQRDPNLPKLYSQSAGVTTFLMHAGSDEEKGKYRSAVVRYLDAVYASKASEETLAKLTGKSYDQLDREYREFLQQLQTKP